MTVSQTTSYLTPSWKLGGKAYETQQPHNQFAMGLALILALPERNAEAQSCIAPPSGMVGWWPGDGLNDLLCQVSTAQFLIQTGDSNAVLQAKTFAGQAIQGQEAITIVPQ